MASINRFAPALSLMMTLMAVLVTADRQLLPEIDPEILPFMDNVNEEEVLSIDEPPPGYEPATTEAEWEPIFQANLFRDLRRYKEKVAKARHPLNLTGLVYQLALLKRWRHVMVVVIVDNVIYSYLPTTDKEIRQRGRLHVQSLAAGAERLQLQLPNTIYCFNLYDEPICELAGRCVVPVFSMHKRINITTDSSVDDDVLLPHLGHSFNRLLFYPWHQKDPRAMLRATMQASMDTNCVRAQLANLAAKASGGKLLDVGFFRNRKRSWDMPKSYQRPYIPMTRHAMYKFLINADGHVSSSRLGYIMQTNSVILKQRSPWIEYYYRSLVPGIHVLEYGPEDVLDLLTKYKDPKLDGELRRLANASQHFCAKYLTIDGKVRYTIRALQEYTQLYGDAMPALVRNIHLGPGRELSTSDIGVLMEMMRTTKWRKGDGSSTTNGSSSKRRRRKSNLADVVERGKGSQPLLSSGQQQ
ncbi:hypothetical protein Vretimale_12862 [Volvox reticuliferus]|uniref:Uncharacterized protein n=1 Tax=Volvox reticuliferus TaxID=1737510 RepID=A0A8J4CFK3_9CHLO|nr:hypothetical protein Vretifemale_9235 [Volvox reticuliferus]GIM08959.1 hypothetical protein Vretimale_12862 [Volvox reticuliferus]